MEPLAEGPPGMTTIVLVGFPPEGVLPRELKNLCRFLPGFEGAHVAFAGMGLPSTLFVKFQAPDLAQAAAEQLHGAPFDVDNPQFTLKAEWARREMEVRPHSPLPAPLAEGRPAPAHARPGGCGPAAWPTPRAPAAPPTFAGPGLGGRRVGATGGELVTIVVMHLRDKGIATEDLQAWFRQRPGFASLSMNERIDSLFVRFATSGHAEQAMREVNQQNISAEWARRNLDDDRGGAAGGAPVHFSPAAGGCLGGGAGGGGAAAFHGGRNGGACGVGQPYMQQGKRLGVTGGELVTICVMQLAMKNLLVDQLQEFFQQHPGFDKMQHNERINGLFVKFFTAEDAEAALGEANRMGWGAEWARRNLDDDPASRAPPMRPPAFAGMRPALAPALPLGGYGGGFAPQPGGPPKRMRPQSGEIDTLTVLHVSEKERQHGSLQGWFADRPGYVVLQVNEKIDAMFVKFSSRAECLEAIAEANSSYALGAELARRNLDL